MVIKEECPKSKIMLSVSFIYLMEMWNIWVLQKLLQKIGSLSQKIKTNEKAWRLSSPESIIDIRKGTVKRMCWRRPMFRDRSVKRHEPPPPPPWPQWMDLWLRFDLKVIEKGVFSAMEGSLMLRERSLCFYTESMWQSLHAESLYGGWDWAPVLLI